MAAHDTHDPDGAHRRSPTMGADRDLETRLNRLAAERGALFDKAAVGLGLSSADKQRLQTVERELDECFIARRQHRAARDAARSDRDLPWVRRRPAR